MRRRLWCAKYALALLASAAVTFHLLYAPPGAGHDVGSQWTRDYEESDAKTSDSLAFSENTVFHDVETISKLEVSVETFGKIDADRGVGTLRRLDVVTPREPGANLDVETAVFNKNDAETTSTRNLNVETQMKSGIDLDNKTLNKNNVIQDVGRPKNLDVDTIIEVHRKLDSVFNVEMLRKPSILAYIESSNIAMLGVPDAVTPKKYIYKQNWSSKKTSLSNFSKNTNSSSGYTVIPENVTIHVGNDRISFNVTFLDSASGVCDDFDVARTSLVVFVASSVEHFEKRTAVRDTWGLRMLQMSDNFRVVFLLGRPASDEIQELVQQEIYRYGDIVQVDETESFRNLGLKSVAGLKWSRDFCPKADLVMKTDDDILVHVPNLLDAVGRGGTMTSNDELLMCHENRKRKILRKELLDEADLPGGYHKYQVSEDELPGTYYPPYCSGMAYVFSASVRDKLLDACSKTPVFFIEDVHVTGFCRHKSGVRIRPHPGITLRPPVHTSCSFKGDDRRITSQELDVPGLRLLWAELNSRGFFCPQLLGLRRNTHPTSRG